MLIFLVLLSKLLITLIMTVLLSLIRIMEQLICLGVNLFDTFCGLQTSLRLRSGQRPTMTAMVLLRIISLCHKRTPLSEALLVDVFQNPLRFLIIEPSNLFMAFD